MFKRVLMLVYRVVSEIEHLLFGRTLVSLFHREKWYRSGILIVRAIENSFKAIASKNFVRRSVNQGIPVRAQGALTLVTFSLILCAFAVSGIFVSQLNVVDVSSSLLTSVTFGAIALRLLTFLTEQGDEDIDEAVSRLVATHGVVKSRSDDTTSEPLPQAGSSIMHIKHKGVPFTLDDFESVLLQNKNDLEAKSAARALALKEDFDRSPLSGQLEFDQSPCSTSPSKARR